MKLCRLATCCAFASLFAFGATIQASHAQSRHDNLRPSVRTTFPKAKLIYLVAGAFDSGGANDTGLATSVTCRNFSNNNANVTVRFFDGDANTKVGEQSFMLLAKRAETVSTNLTFNGEASVETGYFDRGTAIVSSTESAVFCSAMVVDAAGSGAGFALHMVRFNKHPGSEE